MRTPRPHRTVIAIAVWMLCAGVLFAADDLAPAGDPTQPGGGDAATSVDDLSRGDAEDPFRISVPLPSIFPGADVIDIIIRWDGRLNAGDLFNQGPRQDVVEPGDPCHEGTVGALVMCRG